MATIETLYLETTGKLRFDWFGVLKLGLLGGVIALYLCLVGLVATFGERDIVGGVIAFGHTLLILTTLGIGYVASRRVASAASEIGRSVRALLGATLAGLLTGGMVALLVAVADTINLRTVLISVSPELIDLLRFNQETVTGVLLLLAGGAVVGALGGGIYLLPAWARSSLLIGLSAVILMGLLRDILRVVFAGRRFLKPVSDFLFAPEGLTREGAVVLLLVTGGLAVAWLKTSQVMRELMRRVLALGATVVLLADWLTGQQRLNSLLPPQGLTLQGAVVLFLITAGIATAWSLGTMNTRKRASRSSSRSLTQLTGALDREVFRWVYVACGIILILILPFFSRDYLSNVVDKVGLYILMGLGLNIVVGYAGLLDLGYVAFYAIGAYTMGVLTNSSPELSATQVSFWVALPVAVGVSVLAGVILGVPVLNMRGDYLAIVTLGFGEIIGKLAISDWLRPYIGGAQGILAIPRPSFLGKDLVTFQNLYYVILGGCVIALFVAWRLRDSRLGRAWMAMREDEDVAEAMGIDLVRTKLLAFAIGAGCAGASGAIFASQVGSAFPHSFQLWISINVLCLIIVGGIGSLPGVVVGSLFLVGLPEVLSELQEYRLLFFGAALVVMMLARPEGLLPEATRKRELHTGENETGPPGEVQAS